MPPRIPEVAGRPADSFVSRRTSNAVLGEPDVNRFYLGPHLRAFLRRTAEVGGIMGIYEKVMGKYYIPGERGKTGIHVLLKRPLEDTRPDFLPALIPRPVNEIRYLQL